MAGLVLGLATADLPEPADCVVSAFDIVGLFGHARSGVEMCLRPVEVAERGERVTGMNPDPEIVRPTGQVRLDPRSLPTRANVPSW